MEEQDDRKKELEMNVKGYYRGKMCPFVVASVGGTTVITGNSTLENYEWKHLSCMGKFCKLWDDNSKDCSFNVMVDLLREK